MPSAAVSISALREMIAQFLPPNSMIKGRTYLRFSKGAVNAHAHRIRTGEGHAIHFRAVDQRLANRAAGTGDEIDHAFGKPASSRQRANR